jgi:hypothetical protein
MQKTLDIGEGLKLSIEEVDYAPAPRPQHIRLLEPFLSTQFARVVVDRKDGEAVFLDIWPKGGNPDHPKYQQVTVRYLNRAKAIEQLAKWTRKHWQTVPIAPGAIFAQRQQAAEAQRRLERLVGEAAKFADRGNLPKGLERSQPVLTDPARKAGRRRDGDFR